MWVLIFSIFCSCIEFIIFLLRLFFVKSWTENELFKFLDTEDLVGELFSLFELLTLLYKDVLLLLLELLSRLKLWFKFLLLFKVLLYF